MGLMLGNFVDDYTVNCIDVFAMPQSGTSVTVEAVDPVFQHKMLEMLKQTGRCVQLCEYSLKAVGHICPTINVSSVFQLTRRLPVSSRQPTTTGRRWWSGGTTATRASAAGSPAWTSTRSR